MHCPAPLPEEPTGPLLTKMLVPTPYEAPKKEDSKKVKKTRSCLRRRETSDAKSEDTSGAPSSEDKEEEAEEGEPSHPEAPPPAADSSPEWDPRAQPREKS